MHGNDGHGNGTEGGRQSGHQSTEQMRDGEEASSSAFRQSTSYPAI